VQPGVRAVGSRRHASSGLAASAQGHAMLLPEPAHQVFAFGAAGAGAANLAWALLAALVLAYALARLLRERLAATPRVARSVGLAAALVLAGGAWWRLPPGFHAAEVREGNVRLHFLTGTRVLPVAEVTALEAGRRGGRRGTQCTAVLVTRGGRRFRSQEVPETGFQRAYQGLYEALGLSPVRLALP
jgi:hypothetical protein